MKKENIGTKVKAERAKAVQSFGKGVTELDKEKLILAVWEVKMNELCNSGEPVTNEWPHVIAKYNALGDKSHNLMKLKKTTWKDIRDN
ncbi:hypothetical protein AXF42_Ash010531 [Apostasia shenzhenica]|uniref:Myb/SANT-like domain-containing protein n=1 Tax=Apostasia shenzhenica TaxID=1088818 RepID=A0A2I0A6C1_9ASPA|nr:hypothetical protein AXF42_Ash010531 [Apostasia shenzhenica]